ALDDAAAAGAEPAVVESLRSRAREWGERVDGVCGPAQSGAAAELTAVTPQRGRNSRTLSAPPPLRKQDVTAAKTCNTYIARTRTVCVLPEGHPGWPKTGHRSKR
ncbi:MAG TPA: hypothetical protein VFC06_06520, partial [Demequina sp.]|nr:hypothetical protein [Demequina sp.]